MGVLAATAAACLKTAVARIFVDVERKIGWLVWEAVWVWLWLCCGCGFGSLSLSAFLVVRLAGWRGGLGVEQTTSGMQRKKRIARMRRREEEERKRKRTRRRRRRREGVGRQTDTGR